MYEIFMFCLSYGLEFVISSRNEIIAFILEHTFGVSVDDAHPLPMSLKLCPCFPF